MTQHQDNVSYFRMMAAKAKTLAHRIYWLGRAEGKEAADKQRAADAEARRKIAEREENLNRFELLLAPEAELTSMHPLGCTITWEKPADWDPDTYICLVRDGGTQEWRSVATSNIGRDTRQLILPTRYLVWGDEATYYEICIAAVLDGVGRKESNVMMYPDPAPLEQVLKESEERIEKPKHIREEGISINVGTAIHPTIVPHEEYVKNRRNAILETLDNMWAEGNERMHRNENGKPSRPYIDEVRRMLNIKPRITAMELQEAFRKWKRKWKKENKP